MSNEARTSILSKIRGKRPCAPSARRRARPALEWLEKRIILSVGGGWISSTQSGQSGDGMLGQYYSNSTLAGTPSFTRWDNRVDLFSPGSDSGPGGSPDPAFGSVGPDDWSAEWTGTLTANFSETYSFVINSAGNGERLWVTPVGQQQGNPLINDWTSHGQTTDTATMTLQSGQDYNVELEYSQGSGSVQQVQLQWSSPSTPLEDIEPVTQVGLNVDGGDALFANLVNGGTRDYWWVAGNQNATVPIDSNFWPKADAEVFLGEGDTNTEAGGSYLVQFTGMATVSDSPQNVDWWVNGTDLHSGTLEAGQGYNPVTNTTTATMVVSPGPNAGYFMTFTNTSRTSNSSMQVTAISEANGTVTVSVPSVTGIATNQKVTVAGYGGAAAAYNGTFVITGVNTSNNTFTYTDSTYNLPNNPSGGTALVNPENGITNLYVMQPTTLGGNTPAPVGTLFNPAALSLVSEYTVLRFMDLNSTNGNLTSNWSDRTLVSDNFWSAYTFNSGSGVDTGVSNANPGAGVPWEIQVALANESGKDIYITIPSNVSTSYLTNLADLFAYGSNGVTPYTSVQANPVWKPLNSNLKVYIEFSNETWNSGFVQAESRGDGWANQLSQRALYDYLTNNQNDPLYPGSGANAYNDGEILAAYYNINSSNDGAFLSTYNANPAPSTDGGSPDYFSNSAPTNGYYIGQGWVGLRIVQISDAFKTAFGETDLDAVATDSRVRPLFEWQYGGNWSGALGFINSVYGAQDPVNYYLYGGGGGWYAGDDDGGFSDVSFVNPAFANGLTGWSSTGSAGVVNNGSNMGNPNAPPLFSAIAITNGATESGNTVTITTTTPLYFAAGQSVTVSGVNIGGYNGTFTITSVTSTTFTYQDPTKGLANSGDGIVTGNSSSTQTAYLQPGASISQNVTFSDGYADITLYATQTVPNNWVNGLAITLTPTNGGPAINNGQPILESEGAPLYSGNQNAFVWDRTEAFYTGASDYTYKVTFTNTLPSGTVFFDNVAIQTVNGIFNESAAALPNISGDIQSDVNLALEYGLHDVGYEGGFEFNQNRSGYLDLNGYRDMGASGYSSAVPNVGMYANLDPRTEQLAIATLDQFYAAGGTLPVVFESAGNTNSWAVAAPTFYNTDTPKQQAAASVEQTAQSATYGLKPGQWASGGYWLNSGNTFDSTYLVPLGAYSLTMSFAYVFGNPSGQTDSVEVVVDGQLINTVNVPDQPGGTFTVSIGTLTAGQHSVELIDTAPSGNGALGGPYDYLNYTGPATVPIIPSQPSITWGAPSSIVYGTPLGSSQLDAIANVPGTFAYTPAAGAILAIGVDTLSVTFTPNDSIYYTTATATTTITVVAVPGGTTQVNLSSAFNRTGIVADGTKFSGGGLDGGGYALSSSQVGTTLTAGGATFDLGPVGANDVVSTAGQTIALPAGQDVSLDVLATGVNGNQTNQTFTVKYSDGTTATFTQSLSDWFTPQNYSGESKAVTMAYRDLSNGTKDNQTFFLYGYTFALNSAKTVSSLTLPKDANVELVAATLVPAQSATSVSLSGAFNRTGIYADGSTFSTGGLDGGGFALSANLLGTSQTWMGNTFAIGSAGSSDVVSTAGQTIALPAGQDVSLDLLATGVNGNQTNQTFTVKYSDGTTATFTQSLSDWFTPQNYSGESKAVTMAYRDLSNGTKDNQTFFVYGYTFALNSAKTVSSITLPKDANVEVLAINVSP